MSAVELRPPPGSPAAVAGAFNCGGEIVPVLNLRPRFLLPARELGLDEHFLLVRSRDRLIALRIDEVQDVGEFEEDALVPAKRIAPHRTAPPARCMECRVRQLP